MAPHHASVQPTPLVPHLTNHLNVESDSYRCRRFLSLLVQWDRETGAHETAALERSCIGDYLEMEPGTPPIGQRIHFEEASPRRPRAARSAAATMCHPSSVCSGANMP